MRTETRMRNRPVALMTAALLAGLAACVDLNEHLVSGLANQPYNSPQVLDALVNATYEPLRSFWAQERGFTVTEFGTDIYTKGADGSHKFINDYTTQPATPGTTSTGRSTPPTRWSGGRRSWTWTRAARRSASRKPASYGRSIISSWCKCTGP